MAATYVYVVTSASYIPGPTDPTVTIVGSVDGVPVTVQVWLSAIQQAQASGGMTAVKNLVAPVMLAQARQNAPPAAVAPVELPTGTFTQ
ncbi:MAG: hypothetical protein ACRD2O_00170 [Terriglobia bacterium]